MNPFVISDVVLVFLYGSIKLEELKTITGIDITDISINNLKQKYPDYDFFNESISSPLLVSKLEHKFSILNVFDILYHIKDDKEFRKAVEYICSLTKDNGFIFITDLYGSTNIDISEHVEFRSKDTYETTLSENGIKIIAAYPLCYLLNRPIFARFKTKLLQRIGRIADNLFAPVYYFLDGLFLSESRNNLNLIVARKKDSCE